MGHAHRSLGDDGHNDPKVFLASVHYIYENLVIDKTYDIPFLAGLSRGGYVYYRDRHMPDFWEYRGKQIDVDRALVVHEWIEFLIENKGGQLVDAYKSHMYAVSGDTKYMIGPVTTFDYALSHQLAQSLEQKTITLLVDPDINPASDDAAVIWNDWTAFCDIWVKTAESEEITRCPADLYLQPYEDDGADMDLLQAIADAGGPKSYLLYDKGEVGGADGHPFYEGD